MTLSTPLGAGALGIGRPPQGPSRGTAGQEQSSGKPVMKGRRGSAPAGAAAGIATGGMGASAPIIDQNLSMMNNIA